MTAALMTAVLVAVVLVAVALVTVALVAAVLVAVATLVGVGAARVASVTGRVADTDCPVIRSLKAGLAIAAVSASA
jgi:uncharacterized protein YqfA (UPF0365 family)